MLEIGIGNGFVSKYLKERKIKVTTVDIDERLNPDIAGSVLELPFAKGSFDVVACYSERKIHHNRLCLNLCAFICLKLGF